MRKFPERSYFPSVSKNFLKPDRICLRKLKNSTRRRLKNKASPRTSSLPHFFSLRDNRLRKLSLGRPSTAGRRAPPQPGRESAPQTPVDHLKGLSDAPPRHRSIRRHSPGRNPRPRRPRRPPC